VNVLLRAACGRPLTEPVRLLPEPSERPERDGRPLPDAVRLEAAP
jgi:hypothetical protein